MSTIKSSDEHLTINADGSGKSIKFQANGVEKASISSAGAFTSTTIDATKLTGDLPAISGANLTGISGGKILQVKFNNWHPGSSVTITNQMWITNLDVTITPTSANSRFISFITFGMLQQSSDAKYIEVRYYRDSTAIDGGGYGLGYSELNPGSLSNNYKPHSYTYEHLETAGNTNARTYKIRFNTDGDWAFHSQAANTHIVMEYEV